MSGVVPGGRQPVIASLAAVLVAGAMLASCAGEPTGSLSVTPGPNAVASLGEAEGAVTPGPSEATPPDAPLASPVKGVLTHLDNAGLGKVTGFTLLVPDGSEVDFTMGVQENAAEFPAAHLSEHLASSEPVKVWFREEGGALVVYRIEDASGL